MKRLVPRQLFRRFRQESCFWNGIMFSRSTAQRRFSNRRCSLGGFACLLGLLILFLPCGLRASLDTYDAAISDDSVGGLAPLARLLEPVTLTGSKPAAFNFGDTSG